MEVEGLGKGDEFVLDDAEGQLMGDKLKNTA